MYRQIFKNSIAKVNYLFWLVCLLWNPVRLALSLAFRLRSSLYGGCKRMDSRDFFQHIDHAALGEGFFQAAKVRGLLAKRCQPLPQSGIIGLNVGGVLALVEQDNGLFLILRQGHILHSPIPRCTPCRPRNLPLDSRSQCAQKPFRSADMLPSLSED